MATSISLETRNLIVADLRKNILDTVILDRYKITAAQLRAIKAHITMGTYGRANKPMTEATKNRVDRMIGRGRSTEEIAKATGHAPIQIMARKAINTIRES